jgi:transcriptional regulator with XRE-family HTH domain
MTMADRISEVMTIRDVTVSQLAKVASVDIQSVYQWRDGSTKNIKNEYLFAVADYLQVYARWLATGEGPRDTDERQIRLYNIFYSLDERGKTTLLSLGAALAAMQ